MSARKDLLTASSQSAQNPKCSSLGRPKMAKQQWKSITRAGAALALGAVLSWGFWLLGSLSLGQSLVMAFVLGGLFGLLWFMARRTAPARPVSSSIQRLIDGV